METEKGWLTSEFLGEDEMRRAAAQHLGVPFVLLTHDDIAPAALVLIPEPLSRAHSAVAYRAGDDTIEVALLDIADLEQVVAAITSLHPSKKIKPRLTNQASIKQALIMYQKHLKDVYGNALQAGSADALILHALLNQASDIHLDVLQSGTRIRYRIQGVLHEAMRLSVEAGEALVRSVKQLGKLFPVAVAQEGKFKVEREGESVLVSIANIPGVEGERLTMRLAHERSGHRGFTLSALGLHGKGLEEVHSLLHAKAGLVLVCGPQGSGKTTTLYTLFDHVQDPRVAIATIEKNREHTLLHVVQTQARPEVGLTMLAGLKAVLRTDPDVVLVDPIDSAESALVALEAARRGVRVFAAIDARSAAQAIEMLLSFDIPRNLIATTVLGVIGQRLAHKLDTAHKQQGALLIREEAAMLEPQANFGRILATLKEEECIESHIAWKDVVFYSGDERAGFIGLQEVLTVTPRIKELIMQEVGAEDIEAAARQEGMLTLVEDALYKAAQGLISIEEIVEVASE